MGTKVKREFPSRSDSIDVVQEASELNSESIADPKCISTVIYKEEWERLCQDKLDLRMTRERALCGGLRACRLRSVSWMLLLGALSPKGDWALELNASRSHYSKLKQRLHQASTLSPTSSPNEDNPLSQNDQSSWHQYFCDRDLCSVIRQDVIRTFPGVDFFRDPSIQEAMVNVLFCYARENPTMCYRQGMHEVLAPLLFVLHCDHQALLHTQELLAQVSEEICVLLDPAYLEEDSYTLFRRVMSAISGWYLISDVAPTSTGYFPPRSNNSSKISTENQVLSQLNWIKEKLLSPNDPQLYHHLEQLDIPLPLFGIRWLRLLFGREFPLQDLLVLWDAIFADSSNFELVNYIVLAMLVAIRNHLLASDYTSCLTLLMRYPGSVDISFIIEYALHLKNPKRYNSPTMKAMVPRRMVQVGIRRNDDRQIHEQGRGEDSHKKNSHLVSVKFKSSGAKPRHQEKQKRMKPPFAATPQSQNSIVDGYTLDDPALVVAELRHAYALMSLCRIKLEQYHRVLEPVIPENDIPAQEALTGIHELCSLMEIRGSTITVEPATEAGESNSPLSKTSTAAVAPTQNILHKSSLVDMKVFKQSFTPFVDGPISLPPYNQLY